MANKGYVEATWGEFSWYIYPGERSFLIDADFGSVDFTLTNGIEKRVTVELYRGYGECVASAYYRGVDGTLPDCVRATVARALHDAAYSMEPAEFHSFCGFVLEVCESVLACKHECDARKLAC